MYRKPQSTDSLVHDVIRKANTLNRTLRNAEKRGYGDFAEFKHIERLLRNSGFNSRKTKTNSSGKKVTRAIESRSYIAKMSEEDLQKYNRVLDAANASTNLIKGNKGKSEFVKRATTFQDRIFKGTGLKMDIEDVYDLVHMESQGIWARLEALGFSSSQRIEIIENCKKSGDDVDYRLDYILKFFEQNGLTFDKNIAKEYLMNGKIRPIAERYYKLGRLSNEWKYKYENHVI